MNKTATKGKITTMNKTFAVYKPKGPTSADIVSMIKKISKIKKVGHAGTLDPLAKGVLVIGVGREATKKLKSVVASEKVYLAKIKLGVKSSTEDEEGEKTVVQGDVRPSLEELKKTVNKFKGQILQIPPIFSAIKVKGKEAYKYAREGENIKLGPRKIEIKEIEVLQYSWPYLTIQVITGPGVYIRSLARDIGEKLKTGAYLSELERIRVGQFKKEETLKISQLKSFLQQNEQKKKKGVKKT